METSSPVPDRPGKTAVWTTSRARGRFDAQQTVPSTTQPADPGVRSLDEVRQVFWDAYRHLFPPHSLAAQMPNGSVVISWSIMDEPSARYPYAAPVMLRFDPDLLETMSHADAGRRAQLAAKFESNLREGLRGYDPFARFPNARVVIIG
ncbi:MAG TPA: hypothetical protein VHL79_24995 [Ramlibacter sp.]|nr:hypothetical protein [Ramlibacter sp.]